MSEEQPELKINVSGVIGILIILALSIVMVIVGYRIGNAAIIVWGYIFLLSTSLSMLVVFSRIYALKVFVGSIRAEEDKKMLEERIRKIMEEMEEEETVGLEVEE